MDIAAIRYLSSQFRHGIEIAHRNRLFRSQPFWNFPDACCGDAPDLLTQYLYDNAPNEIICCKYVHGTFWYDDPDSGIYEPFGHSWLVVDGSIIVDITADQRQFKNDRIFPQDAVQPCFVGTKSKFHSLFEIDPLQCGDCCGLQSLGESSYLRLKEIYDIIKSCI